MAESGERKLAAILNADVVGYSRLMAQDEDATVRMVTFYRQQVEMLVPQHRGRLADFTGDNFLAEFPTAVDGVRCAIEIQRVLRARNTDLAADRKMEFRIGLHLGDVRVQDERLFGTGVNGVYAGAGAEVPAAAGDGAASVLGGGVPAGLAGEARRVWLALSERSLGIGDVASGADLQSAPVLAALTVLQVAGLVVQESGMRFRRAS